MNKVIAIILFTVIFVNVIAGVVFLNGNNTQPPRTNSTQTVPANTSGGNLSSLIIYEGGSNELSKIK